MPLKLADVGETGRISEAIKEQGCVSLRDSFNMKMYINPVWKSVDKAQWKNPRGMSYKGQTAPHVSSLRKSLLGGTGLANATLAGSNAKQNRGGSWAITRNEELNGANPYAGGH